MARMNFGIFRDRDRADAAVKELEDAGYNPKDISFIMKDMETEVVEGGSRVSSAAEGAVSGAATGTVVGGLAGLLIGIGALAIPGIGAVLIGGPIAAALGLAGAAATTVSGAITGALAGGLVGGLIGLGIPKETAEVYEERVRAGGILLAVPEQTREGRKDSMDILKKHGAEEVKTIDIDDKVIAG